MPTVDLAMTGYAAIWTALRASTEFAAAIVDANQIDELRENFGDKGDGRGDGDFPEAKIELGVGEDSQYTKTGTFATHAVGGATSWIETFKQTYLLVLTMPNVQVQPASALRDICLRALRKAGNRLGSPYIQSYGPVVWRHGTQDVDGTKRHVVLLQVPVVFQFQGQTQK